MKGVIFVLGAICSVMFYGCNQSGCTDPLAANYEVKATTDDGSCVYLASISTIPITDVGFGKFNSGGVIDSDGGQNITVRGICWSTNPNPTIANDTTINGFGTGAFTSSIDGLQTGTYYVRAYATSINGTSYGNELSVMITSVEQGIAPYLGNTIGLLNCQGTTGEWPFNVDSTNVAGYDIVILDLAGLGSAFGYLKPDGSVEIPNQSSNSNLGTISGMFGVNPTTNINRPFYGTYEYNSNSNPNNSHSCDFWF